MKYKPEVWKLKGVIEKQKGIQAAQKEAHYVLGERSIEGSQEPPKKQPPKKDDDVNKRIKILDASGSNSYKVNSPAGEYGILYATGSSTNAGQVLYNDDATLGYTPCGLLYYQAGVAVISGSVFGSGSGPSREGGKRPGLLRGANSCELGLLLTGSGYDVISGSTIETMADGIRNRIYNVQFNNTTELNSSIYFCRINHNECNR